MENNKWIGLLYYIILRQLNTSTAFDVTEENLHERSKESPLVEVRAVFINCEIKGSAQEESVAPDSDLIRFEREELFKHSVLRDCNKKLAVTVKIACEPDSSGDEYLPIEHVFEGPEKKRVRLLDPYILRLRREAPLQAYKLRRVDTISGILLDTAGKTYSIGYNQQKRIGRHIGRSKAWTPESEVYLLQTNPMTPQGVSPLQLATPSIIKAASHPSRRYIENVMCTNSTLSKRRRKRSEHNIVVEEAVDDGKQWDLKEQYYRISEPVKKSGMNPDIFDETEMSSHNTHHRVANVNHKRENTELSDTKPLIDEINKPDERSRLSLKKLCHFRISDSKEKESRAERKKNTDKNKTSSSSLKTKEHKSHSSGNNKRLDNHYDNDDNDDNGDSEVNNDFQGSTETAEDVEDVESPERDFAVYEIGVPELWYTMHVQLFEKLSTPDGKTVWNDLTKGEQASVSSKEPEWTGQDMNVRYRPAEWIPRDEFSLPTSRLCLLAPIRDAESSSYNENNTNFSENPSVSWIFSDSESGNLFQGSATTKTCYDNIQYNIELLKGVSEDGGYIVLPEEDVMGVKYEEGIINKRNDNNTDSEFSPKSKERNEQGRRRVVLRTSRALLSGTEDKVNIAYKGVDKYLTLPHRQPHHAQIDLEVRADENELVRVGASGRIAIAVADSTRRTRTILTLQVGNTGLAAARFRVKARDCGPALSEMVNEKNKHLTMAGPVLIPPRHTRSLRLELPLEIPVDVARCSVALVNDDEKSIAVREVAIKKGDRCFCVWHCDCVCLSDDPRLLCREMAASRQSAAGLANRDRTRHARSACYKDAVYLNLCIIMIGVIFALLVLGCLKAIVGQLWFFIGTWGLDQLVQVPRKMDHYFEQDLKDRQIEYDCDGWPVHPETRERTVRMYSRPMEFVLNVIFFVSVPCMMAYDVGKQLISRYRKSKADADCNPTKNNTKKCFSSQDMQAMAMRWRRRHGGLRTWMTPQAQELSKELWNKGLLPATKCEFMQPLLREVRKPEPQPDPVDPDAHDSCPDSEQDDTEYVITQMQKSRESLSILKQKLKP